jgi:hypothetical protein
MPMDDHPNHKGKVWPVSPVQYRINEPGDWPFWELARVFVYGTVGGLGLIALCIGIGTLFGKHL